MSYKQIEKANEARKFKPFETNLQLVETYNVLFALAEFRKDSDKALEEAKKNVMPKLAPLYESIINKVKESFITAKENFEKEPIPQTKEEITPYINNMEALLNKKKMFDDTLECFEMLEKSFQTVCKKVPHINYIAMLWIAIAKMFKYDFFSCSSVSEGTLDSNLISSYGEDVNRLRSMNLMFHTIHVFNTAVQNSFSGKTYQQGAENNILAAIMHDFGKAPLIRQLLNMEGTRGQIKHEHVSEAFISNTYTFRLMEVFKNEDDESQQLFMKICDEIAFIVKSHHMGSSNKSMTYGIEFVQEADKTARQMEIRDHKAHEELAKQTLEQKRKELENAIKLKQMKERLK